MDRDRATEHALHGCTTKTTASAESGLGTALVLVRGFILSYVQRKKRQKRSSASRCGRFTGMLSGAPDSFRKALHLSIAEASPALVFLGTAASMMSAPGRIPVARARASDAGVASAAMAGSAASAILGDAPPHRSRARAASGCAAHGGELGG
jgi:hypothetical protein